MSNEPKKPAVANNEPRPQWQTPVLIEESIIDATRNRFSAGVDNYETSNPIEYGS